MYKLLLSLRYFRSRFLTIASLLAITFGVAMLVIVLSVMGGYLIQLQENIRGQESHLQVVGPGQYSVVDDVELEETILGVPNVRGCALFVERLAVYHNGASHRLCQVKGIDPERQMAVGSLGRLVLRPEELDRVLEARSASDASPPGSAGLDAAAVVQRVEELFKDPRRAPLSPEEVAAFFDRGRREELLRARNPEVLDALGEDLPPAALVGLQLVIEREFEIGDIVSVVTIHPESDAPEPLLQDFVVAGALKTGDFDQDSAAIYAEIAVARNWLRLCDPQSGVCRAQGVRVAIDDPELLEETRDALQAALQVRLPNNLYEVKTWKDLRRILLKAVLIEKFLVYFVMLILVVFTGSMILLMLLLAVIEKTRDIGVLLALGARPSGITSIFLLNGLAICIVGTGLGLCLGVTFCSSINDIHDAIHRWFGVRLFNPQIYHMDRIPVAFAPLDLFLSTVPPVVIGFVASLIPAVWVLRRDPIKAIQYE